MRFISVRLLTPFIAVSTALVITACSYSSSLIRTLKLTAPLEVSCTETALNDFGYTHYRSGEATLYYESTDGSAAGLMELKNSSGTGYKKIRHMSLNVDGCFPELEAVQIKMEQLEDHVLKSCGMSLKNPPKQEFKDPGGMCVGA